jgi:phosphatidate cytidylyltransferase
MIALLIVGKSIGKTKLFERISPKKTIEGFMGGVVFVASYLISKYYIEIAEVRCLFGLLLP